ncbi:hypothetical protein Dda_4135 [Drechslerella dactyloides]|uniref:Uncharacterized protein n=1 Tax=Drechslerella dactyloides TaxID=74499 RepID=A0AAD6J1I5_DREDA|nr:hypothetical protein Dda_4135 [Drechslerella dactyloides]
MPLSRTHAIIFVGTAPSDMNGAYNFVTALKSCFSISIIPHIYSTYSRDKLFDLLSPRLDQPPDYALAVGDPNSQGAWDLNNGLPSSPPLYMPSRQDLKDMLEIVRPYYQCVGGPDSKLELRKAVHEASEKLDIGDKLVLIIIAQAVHTSGCIVLGRLITNLDIWEYIEWLPIKCTAMLAIISSGSDARQLKPSPIFCNPDDDTQGNGPNTNSQLSHDRPPATYGLDVYTVARFEVLKVLGQRHAEHIRLHVRDWGNKAGFGDVMRDYNPIKLAPWSYSMINWEFINSVPQVFETLLETHINVSRFESSIFGKFVDKLSVGKRSNCRTRLYLPIYYFERKLDEIPSGDGSSTFPLKSVMIRVVEQWRSFNNFDPTGNNAPFLFQRRVEETLRFLERTDLRVEAFIQGSFKSGVFHRITAQGLELDPLTEDAVVKLFASRSSQFRSVIMPPKDVDSITLEYFTQAKRLARLIEVSSRQYEWFDSEKFLQYMQENL